MYILFIFILCGPLISMAKEDEQQIKKKLEWYIHLDERLVALEERLVADLETVHREQSVMNQEMHRLNNKLENRFDKYFLWGYGTLLVVISTLVSVAFNKNKQQNAENGETVS